MTSEVTFVTDHDQAIPVLNTRTGARSLAFGDVLSHSTAMELRFVEANADVKVGDLLSTSGVDGVYPAGLLVAKVSQVTRRSDSAFARVTCTPLALVSGAQHVLVLTPVVQALGRPAPSPAPGTALPAAKPRTSR
jgi:rod shape-determining protein MreC